MKKELSIDSRLDKTIQHYWPNGAQWTAENVTPVLTEFAFRQAEEQMEKCSVN